MWTNLDRIHNKLFQPLNTNRTDPMATTRENPLAGKVRSSPAVPRGIGAAIAKRLAADGASVAVTYSKGADAAAAVVDDD